MKCERFYFTLGVINNSQRTKVGSEKIAPPSDRGHSKSTSRDVEKVGAEPWWKWFKAAMGVVDDAKEAEPQLPKPREIKRIEPPKRQLPKPDTNDMDDEIPF